eukprot:TRINITY_DN1348_c0_g1_i1.p1 TRINITY_DN1348_c0_g1~~TRINITY_DN1348_c0_g1_i1.p1  ORF type:complete len:643 (-),score=160.24 TRINITY_DN1348_c0_g1_i1:79-1728(-)
MTSDDDSWQWNDLKNIGDMDNFGDTTHSINISTETNTPLQIMEDMNFKFESILDYDFCLDSIHPTNPNLLDDDGLFPFPDFDGTTENKKKRKLDEEIHENAPQNKKIKLDEHVSKPMTSDDDSWQWNDLKNIGDMDNFGDTTHSINCGSQTPLLNSNETINVPPYGIGLVNYGNVCGQQYPYNSGHVVNGVLHDAVNGGQQYSFYGGQQYPYNSGHVVNGGLHDAVNGGQQYSFYGGQQYPYNSGHVVNGGLPQVVYGGPQFVVSNQFFDGGLHDAVNGGQSYRGAGIFLTVNNSEYGGGQLYPYNSGYVDNGGSHIAFNGGQEFMVPYNGDMIPPDVEYASRNQNEVRLLQPISNNFDRSNHITHNITNNIVINNCDNERNQTFYMDEKPTYRLISPKKFGFVMKRCIKFIDETEFTIDLNEFKKIFKSGLKLFNNYGLLLTPNNDKNSDIKTCFYRWVHPDTGLSLLNRTSWNRWINENPNWPECSAAQYNPDVETVELTNRQDEMEPGKPKTNLKPIPLKKEICNIPESNRGSRWKEFIDRRLCPQ